MLARTSALILRPFTHASFATAECAKKLLIREGFSTHSILTIRNGAPIKKAPCREALHKLRQSLALPSFTIGFCGRLEKEKNPLFLLKVAALLSKQTKDFCILVIGDGKEKDSLVREASRRSLGKHFRFLGYQENPIDYLALCDVQINCSVLSETSSISLIEGLLLGIPAVVSSLEGNCEIIKNEKNGLIYEKGNASMCAHHLLQLASNQELRKKLSAEAYRFYWRFCSSERMTRKYEYFYEALFLHSLKKH